MLLKSVSLASALVLATSVVSTAKTVDVDFFGKNIPVGQGEDRQYDILSVSPFGVSPGPDWRFDFEIDLSNRPIIDEGPFDLPPVPHEADLERPEPLPPRQPERAVIRTLNGGVQDGLPILPVSAENEDQPFPIIPIFPEIQDMDFATNKNGKLKIFEAGDKVGARNFKNGGTDEGVLYDGKRGPLGDGGSIFVGFRVTSNGFPVFLQETPIDTFAISEEQDFPCDVQIRSVEVDGPYDECGPIFKPVTHYGFIEITRGAAIPGTVGFQTIAGNAAQIPAPLPHPAAGWALIAGLGGLAAMRRAKKA